MSDLFLGTVSQHEAEQPLPTRRSRSRQDGKARRNRQRRNRRRRSVLVIIMAICLVGGAGYVVTSIFSDFFGGLFGGSSDTAEISDYEGPGTGEATVTVVSGDTGGAIGEKLVEAGVVATTSAFTKAYAANPLATQIQPGAYKLRLQMRASDAVDALLDSANRVSLKVTVNEGLAMSQIFEKVSGITAIPVADLEAAAADPAALGLPAEANGSLEGWLFPATYQIEPGATATALLSHMVGKTVEVLTANGVPQDQWETVLIKASLVEREGKSPEDRAKIAQAIENRLDRGMRLEIDAVLAYGLGKPGTALTNADKEVDSPFNSYRNIGLPPSPIASPGEVSIQSVMNPTPGPWIFWCTVNLETGETKFAETFGEHQQNVAELRAWEAANSK
ncbi:endolytic transglycosylase MltG [Cellulomonas chengniuliangii]|uniref:Endolytic murein transglycosylase n=1 Tax=Cellulomonas chengniuliangii TaxID=2968084 RepID=A0ABY5L4Q9_9CELL|nr:endolytic transglycosylase MltG [Cellulomonas chengniuliangii]MCC2308402.1 endolytic transglycosylase MltG [Cellulomonas chengniuliangii]MCC2317419.1 endolytic transglycosylase MltG [Cellulomonas chengniuliangii]UUI76779.1 endolytic transglycosylase MltG [Cellulomonas chengniuliangii]